MSISISPSLILSLLGSSLLLACTEEKKQLDQIFTDYVVEQGLGLSQGQTVAVLTVSGCDYCLEEVLASMEVIPGIRDCEIEFIIVGDTSQAINPSLLKLLMPRVIFFDQDFRLDDYPVNFGHFAIVEFLNEGSVILAKEGQIIDYLSLNCQ